MKIIAISDTHGQHEQLTSLIQEEIKNTKEEDEYVVLIHCGDHEGGEFHTWFSQFKLEKYYVNGNHDENLDCIPLQIQNINGLNFLFIFGGYYQGILPDNNCLDADYSIIKLLELYKNKNLISNIDVVVSHQPAKILLDGVIHSGRRKSVGSIEIKKVLNYLDPKIFLCGHIHDAGGKKTNYKKTMCYNVSCLGGNHQKSEMYKMRENPITVIKI